MLESSEPAVPATTTDALFEEVYERLKAMAGRQRARGDAAQTLGTTELVHELYLRMGGADDKRFADPAQFFSYAARAMRHVLSDRARDHMRQRAGGEWLRVTLSDDAQKLALESAEQALLLDQALRKLEQTDTRAARVVELHFFAGLTMEQIAESFALTRRTVTRDWEFARAFLHSEMH